MIVQTTKATQADFLRDFAVCSDDTADESDATQADADEEDARSVDDHYRQSWKSLHPLGTPGPRAETANHYALSRKSLPLASYDQPQVEYGRQSPGHWTLSRKKLPSSGTHTARINGEEAVPEEGIDDATVQSCQDSAIPMSPRNHEGGPRKTFRHSPMTAEEQAHRAALLRGKIAEFDAAAAANQESCPAHTSEQARKKRRSRQTHNILSTAERLKAVKKKACRKKARKDIETNDESPSQPFVDVFLFGPLPLPVLQDGVMRTNRKRGKQQKTNKMDKILYLNPELQILMAMLNQLGNPLQNVLDGIANDLFQLHGDPTSVTEIMALIEGWKNNARRQLTSLVKQLEHYGIVPMGGIRVPEEDIACKLSLRDSPRASSSLEDRLNQFGPLFEGALNRLAKQIQERVKDEAAEEAAIERSAEILEKWIPENRLHLSRLVSILTRSNATSASRILIPMGEVVSLSHQDCDTRKDSAVVNGQ
ncbi:hypothetical protein AC578_6010 [Pseudocercospora eumusae]|uniref:Uncharacterized protein n=1 Tax=Pseudocercospora eumusae TaxID=321146 RepID=A0A139HVU0_9PEZI|nr:hypothetical protein AC578_6010 [Pseudocercospora eumusae]